MPNRAPQDRRIGWALALSILFHLGAFLVVAPHWDGITDAGELGAAVPVTLLLEVPEPLAPPEPVAPESPSGQVVDTPQPREEQVPEDADYLAEHNRKVEEETRTRDHRINPEVLSEAFSEDDQLQFEDIIDLNIHDPSTGAQPGADDFAPSEHGRMAQIAAPFQLTNRDGLQRPVPSATTTADLAGAPNNDLLDEEIGQRLSLNTKQILGASYYNRIRRLVNFYWSQNIDNLPRSLPLSRSRYLTEVFVVLDAQGSVQELRITGESGSTPIDQAVVDAFHIAGPFPNPPVQLIDPDGRVRLPDFGFTVNVGLARAPFIGVDPRQGVQFPGILKTTR
jgi:outer membrane biosynthesis protein TonB